ncbi:MAG: tyrosine--tRNA ligase [Candidatus Absconditabacteria bacterium]
MNLKQELEERGFLYQFSDEKLFEVFEKGNEALYCGTDPTADSLHIGHLIPVMAAVNFMKKGNKFYFLVGGATGMIGDPSGKDSERSFLNEESLNNNQKAIYNQLSNLFKNLEKASGIKFEFEVINNIDFYKNMSVLEFLRDCGKYITVNSMMNKETVKKRIEDPDKSISYTEFSYMLLQGFDFYKLYEEKNIKLQIGGSDQWGNLVTGVEIIRKKIDKQGFVMTLPLVTDANGKKFGKSEGNAIWIDKNKSTPYFIYQYFMNTADEDVEKYLKLLTLMSFEQINEIVDKHNEKPELRNGQKALAFNIIQTIHGQEDALQAEKISEILFGNSDKLELLKSMNDNEISALEKETGGTIFNPELLETLVSSGLFSSKGEARKMVQSGGVYLNEEKVTDPNYVLGDKDLINGKYALIRKGKKSYKLIRKI